jgi:hypothetical protein
VLLIWEYLHIKHITHKDLVLSGELEKGEGQQSFLAQRFKRTWRRANEWIRSNAVNDDAPRVSSIFRMAFAAAAMLPLAICVAGIITALAQDRDSNLAFLAFQISSTLQNVSGATTITFVFLDLETIAGAFNTIFPYTPAICDALLAVLQFLCRDNTRWFFQDILVNCPVYFAIVFAILRIRTKAIANCTAEELRSHARAYVLPAFVKLAMPLTFMSSEVCNCYVKLYFEAGEHGTLLKDELKCEGMFLGVMPLLYLITVMGSRSIVSVKGKGSFSLANMLNLKLTFIEMIQIAGSGIYAAYAMPYYSMRRERPIDWAAKEGVVYAVAGVVLLASIAVAACEKTVSEGDAEAVAEENSSTRGSSAVGKQSTSSRGSVSDRISAGKRISLWDGGSKGITSKGRLRSASKRGIGVESFGDSGGGGPRGFQGGSQDEEEGGLDFNPGLM